MRIAIVTYALQIGGIETFIKLLAKQFLTHGHHVSLIETQSEGKWSQALKEEGFEVLQVLPRSFQSRVCHAKRIANALKSYNLIIVNDSPFAQAIYGLLPESVIVIPVLHMYMNSMIHNAASNANNWDMLVAVCPAAQNSAIAYGAPSERTTCIPNGVEILAVNNKKVLSSSSLRLVYLGRVCHQQKGVLYLPGIVKRLIDVGLKGELDIIGDGPDLEILRTHFSEMDKAITVNLHGALTNIESKKKLMEANILLMPSHFEGLPLVLLEAMSLGVVPIVSHLPGCTDYVVRHGENGVLVAPGDEAGFAEAVCKLANNSSNFNNLSIAARSTIENDFTFELTAKKYAAIAQHFIALGERKHRPARNGTIDIPLLGDLPYLPLGLVRPIRKLLRMLGLFPTPTIQPLLYDRFYKKIE